MARILITSGPTRQYIDPVRYLSNASSGKMGCCLAQAALQLGHEVVIVSGPVHLTYPAGAELIPVVSTQDMLQACCDVFPQCDGLIGAAAPCDYRPEKVADHKRHKTGSTWQLSLVETEDIVAHLGAIKTERQWTVGFALETDDARFRALGKLIRKRCNLVVLNGVSAIDSQANSIEIINSTGEIVARESGDKETVACRLLSVIQQLLIE